MNTEKNIGPVEIEFYTDPFCCWSWAMEPAWRRLRYELGDSVNWKYRMGGMFPGTNEKKPGTSITPRQLRQEWKEAAPESRMPISTKVWDNHKPDSSFQACIAVKTAEKQSKAAGEAYLHKLRETLMVEGRNASQVDVLMDVAHKVADEQPGVLDYDSFQKNLIDKTAVADFQEDMDQSESMCITRYPTIIISKGNDVKVLAGYHSYEDILSAINRIDPTLQRERIADRSNYQKFWGKCRPEELDEITTVSSKKNASSYANTMAS